MKILERRVNSKVWDDQLIDKRRFKVSSSFLECKLEFWFWGIQTNYLLLYITHSCHVIKFSKLQNYVFQYYKLWEKELVLIIVTKIDDPKLPIKSCVKYPKEWFWGMKNSCKTWMYYWRILPPKFISCNWYWLPTAFVKDSNSNTISKIWRK